MLLVSLPLSDELRLHLNSVRVWRKGRRSSNIDVACSQEPIRATIRARKTVRLNLRFSVRDVVDSYGTWYNPRGIQTESLPPSASEGILNAQRLKRPSSPHFTIYQPQLTWLGSIANRVTGAGFSVRA